MNKRLVFFATVLVSLSFTVQAELNLEEANVMDVERDGDRFSVTLYHDDEGEDGYANWWQIETLKREKIVRRDLLHSHGTRNFTRSDSAQIPGNVSEVVVRGHDETHGYGGQAIILNVETGEKQTIKQGSEPENFTQQDQDEGNHSNSSSLNKSEDTHNLSVNESEESEGLESNHSHEHEHSEESSHGSSTGFSIESVFKPVKQFLTSLL